MKSQGHPGLCPDAHTEMCGGGSGALSGSRRDNAGMCVHGEEGSFLRADCMPWIGSLEDSPLTGTEPSHVLKTAQAVCTQQPWPHRNSLYSLQSPGTGKGESQPEAGARQDRTERRVGGRTEGGRARRPTCDRFCGFTAGLGWRGGQQWRAGELARRSLQGSGGTVRGVRPS